MKTEQKNKETKEKNRPEHALCTQKGLIFVAVSSDEQEDSEAELLNANVEKKFFKTITSIRKLDKQVLDPSTSFFEDKDFEEISEQEKAKEQPIFYKDLVYDQMIKEDSEQEEPKGETFNEEQKRIREEFLSEVRKASEDDDGVFQKKVKTQKEIEEEVKDFDEFIKQQKRISVPIDDMELLREFWGDDKNLSKEDKFLQYYILSQAWKEGSAKPLKNNHLVIEREGADDEDYERDSDMDRYEADYNMRFEDGTGKFVLTHGRKVEGSLRIKKSTKHERDRKRKKRRKEEKEKKLKELNEQIEEFNDKLEDNNEVEVENKEEQESKMELNDEIRQNDENEEYSEETPDRIEEWWFCDNCQKPIKPGEIRYDCTKCENYTLCKKCLKSSNHPHKLSKKKVSIACKPPKDYVDLIRRVTLACSVCGNNLEHIKGYECKPCQIYFCNKCKVGHEHELKKLGSRITEDKVTQNEDNEIKEEVIKGVYNDILAKELPVKFIYKQEKGHNYGLTDEELILATEKELNKLKVIDKAMKNNNNTKMLIKKREAILKEIRERQARKEAEIMGNSNKLKKLSGKRNKPEKVYIETPTEVEGKTITKSRLATYDL